MTPEQIEEEIVKSWMGEPTSLKMIELNEDHAVVEVDGERWKVKIEVIENTGG